MSKPRPAVHLAVQKAGKIRDHNTCQICGSHDHPEGHHIMDFAFGGAASVDNIVTVCHSCHEKIHRGTINIIKF